MKKLEKKTWSARFAKPTAQNMQDFHSSLPFDYRLYAHDIAGSIAHTNVLQDAGVLTEKEKKKMVSGLKKVRKDIENKLDHSNQSGAGSSFGSEFDDIHFYVEKKLEEKIGNLAQKLHTGRSRNDQVVTDLKLYVRNGLTQHAKALNNLLRVFYQKASKHIGVVMPGYTHLQPAQPVLFSFYMLAYFFMFSRDFERLQNAIQSTKVLPLGSGAFSGLNYPINRKLSAKELGFDTISHNAMEAVSDRDFLIEYHHAISQIALHLSRISEDVILFSSSGFGFFNLDDAYSTGSSIMPNKKNPDCFELIRGKTGKIIGNMQALMMMIKSQPMAYNRDLQEDKEGLFESEKTINQSLGIAANALETMTIHPNVMREHCKKGHLTATEIADYLVSKGVPFRESHGIVAGIVLDAEKNNQTLFDWTLDDFKRHHPLFEKDILQYILLENAIERKLTEGSTSTKSVKKQLQKAKRVLDNNLSWLKKC